MSGYKENLNGEPVHIRPSGFTYEGCCDCHLIHLVSYRIRRIKGKQVIERACYRDDWETQIVRRKK